MQPDPIVVVPADPAWSEEFRAVGVALRRSLGPVARRIDHVGSTSVPGLDAKPVIDVQLSVDALEPEEAYRAPLLAARFVPVGGQGDRSQRLFREPPGTRRVHLHVRKAGSFDEQLNLLFRDYLRTHRDSAAEYARVKWELARRFRDDRSGYVEAKAPTIWRILARAHEWLQASGWSPGPSDA